MNASLEEVTLSLNEQGILVIESQEHGTFWDPQRGWPEEHLLRGITHWPAEKVLVVECGNARNLLEAVAKVSPEKAAETARSIASRRLDRSTGQHERDVLQALTQLEREIGSACTWREYAARHASPVQGDVFAPHMAPGAERMPPWDGMQDVVDELDALSPGLDAANRQALAILSGVCGRMPTESIEWQDGEGHTWRAKARWWYNAGDGTTHIRADATDLATGKAG